MKNIAVIMGGFSDEKIVSMKSGSVVLNHIDTNLFHPFCVIIDNNGWRLVHDNNEYPIDKSNFSAYVGNTKITFDGVFMAIHGPPGENGELQEYLDALNIPYNTSSAKASHLSFYKDQCNQFLKKNGVDCAKSITIENGQNWEAETIINELKLPCFVKPNGNGSSFGISKVSKLSELTPAIALAFNQDTKVLIESFLDGVEVTCGIHNFEKKLTTLPITEIVTENDFFDYEAKYQGKSQEITPARITSEEARQVMEITKKVYQLLKLNGIARVDFIIQEGQPFLIEANTVPGLSEESIIPQQAHFAGLSLAELFNNSLTKMYE